MKIPVIFNAQLTRTSHADEYHGVPKLEIFSLNHSGGSAPNFWWRHLIALILKDNSFLGKLKRTRNMESISMP